MKKVLVTGGVGFIGSNLIKHLVKNDYLVTSIDNYSTGSINNEIKGVKYINDDIENINKIKNNFDLCFHLAAQSRVQPSFDNPSESLRVNVNGTSKVMEWAKINNTKIIYAGSSSKHHDPSDSPYAMYKFLGEQVCMLYRKSYNFNVEICRFYNVYGPHQILGGDYAAVLGIFERQYKNNESLTITGTGEQRRDFTHVDDIVDGLIKCGRALLIPNEFNVGPDEVSGEEFELGRGVNFSINEIANMFGEDYPKEYIDARLGEYDTTLCTDDKAKRLLNWNPKKNIDDYIENFIEKNG